MDEESIGIFKYVVDACEIQLIFFQRRTIQFSATDNRLFRKLLFLDVLFIVYLDLNIQL